MLEEDMSTPNTIANFDGKKPVIDSDDAVMLLIDHQSGLFQTVGDMPMPELRARAAALAKMATLAKLPVITTASVPEGPNGPLIPEIHQNAPHAKYVARKGQINAWDSPDFVAAVKATGRKTLIIAGTITSVCMAFPAIAAAHEGYKVLLWLMPQALTRKWLRRSHSRASYRLVSCRWIQPPLPLSFRRLGTARMPRIGRKSTQRFSRHISS
jgi:isochorismate hydrolase